MKHLRLPALMLVAMFNIAGCNSQSVPGSPGVPEPVRVLENPETGERVRLFKEIWYKVPADYDEEKHISEWIAKNNKLAFTKEITPKADRQQLAVLREKNRASSQSQEQPAK